MTKWNRDNEFLRKALAAVAVIVPCEVIVSWSNGQAVDAEIWALATNLNNPNLPAGNPPKHLARYITEDLGRDDGSRD